MTGPMSAWCALGDCSGTCAEGATPAGTSWPPSAPDVKMSSGGYKLLSGHLMRLDKDKAGKTTVRFFAMENPTAEIPELLLSVYKSAAKSKRLNALSVRRISDVALLPGDAGEHKQFSIQVGEALYYLEARNPEDARLWVDSLRAVMGRDIGLEEDGGACALM